MTVVYWSNDEYRCDAEYKSLANQSMIYFHCSSDEEVIEAYNTFLEIHFKRDQKFGESLVGYPLNQRYVCITGPGGLLHRIIE
jgi:hypothetical protein